METGFVCIYSLEKRTDHTFEGLWLLMFKLCIKDFKGGCQDSEENVRELVCKRTLKCTFSNVF